MYHWLVIDLAIRFSCTKQIGNAISRVYTRYIPGIYLNDSEYMYLVYTWYIPGIYQVYTLGSMLVYTRYIPGIYQV